MEATVKKSNHGANVRRWREWRNVNQDVLAERNQWRTLPA